MKNIEVAVLNPEAVQEAEKMMVCAARLTQKGHSVKNLADFQALYTKPYDLGTIARMRSLPHPTIQKFGVINVVVVGASRRFLAQITRHQNEVKFMSASLQYSDYSGEADFVVPYEILTRSYEATDAYLATCKQAMDTYAQAVKGGISNDSAGYMAPQGLRSVLIISATPYQWKHMIGQRTCKRNTSETHYVMLRVWEELYKLSPVLFASYVTGPFCQRDTCQEGRMSCGFPLHDGQKPSDILDVYYARLRVETQT